MSETMNIQGEVIHKGETETFASGFTKASIVVNVSDGKYDQELPVEFMQDNVAKLDAVEVGDMVDVAFNLRGRGYNGKWYVNLAGWKISVEGKATSDAPQLPPDFAADVKKGVADAKNGGEFDDDIPF